MTLAKFVAEVRRSLHISKLTSYNQIESLITQCYFIVAILICELFHLNLVTYVSAGNCDSTS